MASNKIILFPCSKCFKEVEHDAIECSLCEKWTHRNCAKLSKVKLAYFSKNDIRWYCLNCIDIFPFSCLPDDEFLFENSSIEMSYGKGELYSKCCNMETTFRNSSEFKSKDYESEIDPDNNLFNSIETSCKYFTDTEFTSKISKVEGFSVIHFNIRSMTCNFEAVQHYIHGLDKVFDVIAISETWLKDSMNINEFSLQNYSMYNINRQSKRGGGVLLYVLNKYDVQTRNDMSFCEDDVFECITVELEIPNAKNIMLSCGYRPPGGNIELFNETFKKFLESVNHKNYILCGDLNINLLNQNSHVGTEMFIDLIYSFGLYPLINRPTRVTLGSSTLIDNIYSNMFKKSTNGILVNDISDHLPIFSCIDYGHITKNKSKVYKHVRKITDEAIRAINDHLKDVNWNTIYNETDVNTEYSQFLYVVKESYDKYCPRKKIRIDNKTRDKPWLTKNLIKCCKKKFILYKQFINNRTQENEQRFKNYRNMLTTILKLTEKRYYNDLLQRHKGSVKESWNILNKIIKKNNSHTTVPRYFVGENNKKVINGKEIANGFNNFFC